MTKSVGDLFSSLQRRLIRLDGTRIRVEKLYAGKKLNKFDIEQIYSGLYLDAFVSVERYVEEMFIGYLTGTIVPLTHFVKPQLTFKSRQLALDVLLGGKRYVDWLPYNQTKSRANVFFIKGTHFVL